MGELIQAIRGMNDILPHETFAWRQVEQTFAACLAAYGYQEIRFPFLERTGLFKRTIGEVTDIVEKEMYTFNDLNGESMTLRPEGTAGCVRACLEHGLYRQAQKLWYGGPMFRHERPQKGRYRQFSQLGIEVFGIEGVGIEVELLLICQRLWEQWGVAKEVQLQLNTLGDATERQVYRQALVDYFEAHYEQLDPDSQRRLHRNPLRILDSKHPDMQALIAAAPTLNAFLSETSRQRFEALCAALDAVGLTYTVNTRLVRGLDYYSHMVFEWVTDRLGSQATVCGGGRFDALVEQLGGEATPAVGLAMGIERLLLLMSLQTSFALHEPAPTIFIMPMGEAALCQALVIAEQLRRECACAVVVNTSGGSFKSQFKKADKSQAQVALILGETEMQTGQIGVKWLRQAIPQDTVLQADVVTYLASKWRV